LTEALTETKPAKGPAKGRARMCAVTRAVRPEAELIRFVAAPGGSVVADLRAKLPGRGVWVGAERGLVAEAVKRNAFSRGLKAEAKPAADLPDIVATRLREAAIGRLGLARKAGEVVAGFAKTEAAVASGRLSGLIVAADAAEDGVRKMRQALRRRFGETCPIPVFRLFTAAELGLAIGRADVIHAAVLQGPAGRSFVEAAVRLQRYDGAGDGDGLAEERKTASSGI
jgi:predicted RNA-binding protein YlxR (DUF448 family)